MSTPITWTTGAAPRYVDIYMEGIRWDNAVKLYEQYSREA
jgi:Fe-Mn family superoxide dismutase